MATLHPTKSTTPVPERTEEDNQRLFQLYKGWTLTERDGQVRQWVYQFGYDIQHAQKGERRWVCCLCIKQKRPRPKSYAIKGLQNAEGHLYTDHNGIMDPTGKRQKPAKASEKAHQSIATILQLNPKEPKEQDLINTLIKRFDKTVFQQKLVNWIVNSNQSFSIVNDQDLRDIFNYLNPSVEITKANITDVTVRAIAEREFTNNMERVKDALRKSPGQIHIQYDGWKSGNRHALYGITCVFRDPNNRPQKCVLGLPELTDRHTGENIAGQIIEIIREYEISDKLGYFTLDNASNNTTSMGELGLEFGFDWEKRWVRCVGHVVNIVVKQMLYGKNPDAFEKEVFEGLHTAAKEHEVWRRRGSVGKWHNFAVEVSRSDTWTDMLKKVQAVESQLSDDAQLKKHRPVGVVVDNATRWLSQFSMIERALVLRPFYNSFVQRASNEWEKANLTRAGHIKKGSKLPFFLKEENRMTADDWHVLGTLYDILLDFQLVVSSVANRPTDPDRPLRSVGLGLSRLSVCRSRSAWLQRPGRSRSDSLIQ
ncbi:hypothetical protein HZS61_008243 [Fusarium oxysporum f. sp. conglutinans]|uniref:Uncharacterized protein n=1 Tax=Fusarium oxysporum f. sp. conglutinans TaxID=100902 RepID=A0A8H6LRC0_FUSOX|nr:hypothetical protein HZS61_008240 [Fusarium oxysporum f. sp. conglutinans]KAF6527941.1 hypothetical protein HZS61_008243 [Fusarium oxysporum f. sp. conglutinans]KAG7000799.1 putative AC9 transposase [Fusarium oxysporum f. sp. conglutinans]